VKPVKYLTDTLTNLADTRAALAKANGLPRRGTVVGGPDYLPTVYTPGAAGWTDQLVSEPVDLGDGTGVLEVPPDAEVYAGAKVTVSGKAVTIAAAGTLTKTTQDKYDAIKAAPQAAFDAASAAKGG
jgi:hypothetical protein